MIEIQEILFDAQAIDRKVVARRPDIEGLRGRIWS
jgi:hypothetical protein